MNKTSTKKSAESFALPRRPDADVHERIMARLKAMTPEQVFQAAVRSGIYNPDGTLTERYARSRPSSRLKRLRVRRRRR
jgi:hypothetical protein